MMINIPEHIQQLLPYRPGMLIEDLANKRKLSRIVKLASNENPRGPSPMAIKAIQEVADKSHHYPNPASPLLVKALSNKLAINPKQIICASGIDSLLASIITAFSSENDEVLTSQGTFIGIYVHAGKFKRKLIQVPLRSLAYDLEALINAISSKTKIIYLANPNNPTGTMFFRSDFAKFMARVPKNVLVVLDEAYEAYGCSHPEYVRGLEFLEENVITLRTFSKVYGLAGLRVGYAVGAEKVIAELYKVKQPFEPSRPAQFAAAAALLDENHVKMTISLNQKILAKMQSFFQSIELPFVKSSWTNFIMLHMPSQDFALNFQQECLEKGLILRYLGPFGIPNGLRITTGLEDETLFALNVIKNIWMKYKSI